MRKILETFRKGEIRIPSDEFKSAAQKISIAIANGKISEVHVEHYPDCGIVGCRRIVGEYHDPLKFIEGDFSPQLSADEWWKQAGGFSYATLEYKNEKGDQIVKEIKIFGINEGICFLEKEFVRYP